MMDYESQSIERRFWRLGKGWETGEKCEWKRLYGDDSLEGEV